VEVAVDENEAVFEATLQAIREHQPACLLTIIEARGSTPREAGAKMLLRADGSIVGTIGGGAVEATAIEHAKAALSSGKSGMTQYSIRGEDPQGLGACGGEVQVFIEVLRLKPTLLIAGAGHIAQPLAELGYLMGFRTVVCDDRADLLSRERFPHADELLAMDLHHFAKQASITSRTSVVIVTRGHQHDASVLRQAVSTPAAYIGMIGSRSKVRKVFEDLLRDGVPEEKLLQVHAPIGLRTGGQTPAEIALSIMAEIVLVQHGGTGEPLSWRDNPLRSGSKEPLVKGSTQSATA
jgi:xanthine dehydrogenase accessory factor